MKRIAFLLLLPIYLFSQQNEQGRIDHDTLFLANGAKFVVGDKVHLGYGSNSHKGFEFIHLSPWSIAGPQPLGPTWANHEMTIKKFNFEGTKKQGKIFYLILAGGNLSPYWCEITAAMDNGEIVVAGVNDKKTLAAAGAPKVDVADELAKLNKLFKDSILTKEEYEIQKKKLLSQ